MKADIVIKNGYVCTEDGILKGGVAVKNGIITAVASDEELPEAEKVYDAGKKLIFPGAVEPHCHLEIWIIGKSASFDGELYRECVRRETRAAVQGGITTISSTTMQNAEPMMKRFSEFRDGIAGNAYCDVKFHIAPFTDEQIEDIPKTLAEGVTNYKFLMGYRGEGAKALGMDPRGIDSTFLYKGFKKIAESGTNGMAMVHCEDPEIFEYTQAEVIAEGEPKYYNYTDAQDRARPAISETIDLCKAALIANETGCPLYEVHVSAKETVDMIRYFKGKNFNITAETCPHYLVFASDDEICRNNPEWTHYAKVNPAIRKSADRESLWEGLRDGTIQTIGTDHTMFRPEQKLNMSYWDAGPGTGDGMSASLSVMISEGVNKNRISIDTLRKVMCENTAKAMGLYPKKGTLKVGSDGDIVIIDLNKEWTFDAKQSDSLHPFSLYDGMKLKGAPVATFVRGNLVAENFRVVDEPPVGEYPVNDFPGRVQA